jgi:hypothetical protein
MANRIDDGTIALIMWELPSPGSYSSRRIEDLDVSASIRTSLRRLAPAVDAWRKAADDDLPDVESRWWESVALQPAEAERFALMAMRDDVLLTTQPPLRLVARVTGRPVDKVDRLTDGRLALAMIVGGGEYAADRMAAIAAIAQSTCTVKEPQCGSCPLLEVCHFAEQELQRFQ